MGFQDRENEGRGGCCVGRGFRGCLGQCAGISHLIPFSLSLSRSLSFLILIIPFFSEAIHNRPIISATA